VNRKKERAETKRNEHAANKTIECAENKKSTEGAKKRSGHEENKMRKLNNKRTQSQSSFL
jgi:hypothetical protein